jgi:hypothetical protein
VIVNAALTAYTLEMEFKGRSACEVAFGTFDLVTHRVNLAGSDPRVSRLYSPPRDRQEFVDLLTGIASSEQMRTLLDG